MEVVAKEQPMRLGVVVGKKQPMCQRVVVPKKQPMCRRALLGTTHILLLAFVCADADLSQPHERASALAEPSVLHGGGEVRRLDALTEIEYTNAGAMCTLCLLQSKRYCAQTGSCEDTCTGTPCCDATFCDYLDPSVAGSQLEIVSECTTYVHSSYAAVYNCQDAGDSTCTCFQNGGPTSTITTTTSALFHCDVGYFNWFEGWSYAKQQWCCANQGLGCSTTISTTSSTTASTTTTTSSTVTTSTTTISTTTTTTTTISTTSTTETTTSTTSVTTTTTSVTSTTTTTVTTTSTTTTSLTSTTTTSITVTTTSITSTTTTSETSTTTTSVTTTSTTTETTTSTTSLTTTTTSHTTSTTTATVTTVTTSLTTATVTTSTTSITVTTTTITVTTTTATVTTTTDTSTTSATTSTTSITVTTLTSTTTTSATSTTTTTATETTTSVTTTLTSTTLSSTTTPTTTTTSISTTSSTYTTTTTTTTKTATTVTITVTTVSSTTTVTTTTTTTTLTSTTISSTTTETITTTSITVTTTTVTITTTTLTVTTTTVTITTTTETITTTSETATTISVTSTTSTTETSTTTISTTTTTPTATTTTATVTTTTATTATTSTTTSLTSTTTATTATTSTTTSLTSTTTASTTTTSTSTVSTTTTTSATTTTSTVSTSTTTVSTTSTSSSTATTSTTTTSTSTTTTSTTSTTSTSTTSTTSVSTTTTSTTVSTSTTTTVSTTTSSTTTATTTTKTLTTLTATYTTSSTSTASTTTTYEGQPTITHTTTLTVTELVTCVVDFQITGADTSDCATKVNGQTCTVPCVGSYEGDPAQYTCIPEEGRFSGTGPTCTRKGCSSGLPTSGYDTSDCVDRVAEEWCEVKCPESGITAGLMQCDPLGVFHGNVSSCVRVACDPLSRPTGRAVDNSDCEGVVTLGTCDLICLEGYEGTPTVATCETNNLFSGTAPDCVLVTCAVPGSLSGTGITHNCDGVQHGYTCTARCASGYTGQSEVFSCSNSVISGTAPTCSPTVCTENIPNDVGVDAASCQGKTTGQTCTPECRPGYFTSTAGTAITCTTSSAFSSTPLVCTPSQCTGLAGLSNFSDVSVSTTCPSSLPLGGQCIADCATGYTIVGEPKTIVCSLDSDAALSSAVKFTEMVGSVVRDPVGPQCKGEVCTVGIPNRLGVTHDCTGKSTGETCTATADTGYTGGPWTLQCEASGAITGGDAISVTSATCSGSFGAVASSTCSGVGLGETCWVACATGEVAQYECSYSAAELSGGSPPSLKVIFGTPLSCSRRLSQRRLLGELSQRRLVGECGAAAVAASGLDAVGLSHNCLDASSGSVCIVFCAAGYTIDGPAKTKLCTSGSFSDLGAAGLPTCNANACTYNFPDALGVQHDCSGKTTSQTCFARCTLPGYTYAALAVAESFQCDADGEFTGTNPNCEKVACSPLSLGVAFSADSCIGKVFGDTCSVGCAGGFTGDAAQVFTCSAAGTLQGTLPSCVGNPCTSGWPLDLSVETTACQSLTTAQSCTVICSDGYAGTNATYTCGAAGSLVGSGPTCNRLICADNVSTNAGIASDCGSVAFGGQCTAVCAAGYTGGSSEVFTCEWEGSSVGLQGVLPNCTALECTDGHPVAVWHGHNCSGVVTDEECSVWCKEGYTGGPSAAVTCQGDGWIAGQMPVCSRAVCPDLPFSFTHSRNDCTGVEYHGQNCFIRCEVGYVPLGLGVYEYGWSKEWVCSLDAGSTADSWSVSLVGEDPRCEPALCIYSVPVGVQLVHNCTGARTGDSCVVSCAENYAGEPELFTCANTGSFDGTLPECLIITTTVTTTTGTATTTTSALKVTATFGEHFDVITLQFTEAVLLCNPDGTCSLGPRTTACDTLLESSSLAKLGLSPSCTWSSNRTALHIGLGEGATVAPSDAILILPGVFTHNTVAEVVGSLDANVVEGPPESTAVTAVLEVEPVQTAMCGAIHFCAVASLGGLGRPMRFDWRLGPQTPAEAHAQLEGIVSRAGTGPSLRLSAQDVNTAYVAIPSSIPAPYELEMLVGVTNWLGEVGNASASVVVQQWAPEWQAVRLTPVFMSFESFEEAVFAIKLLPPASCDGSQQQSEVVPSGGVAWVYRQQGAASFSTLQEEGLSDASDSPNIVTFAPFTFAPGSDHELQVQVAGGNRLSFGFSVRPRAPPLVDIVGPQQASASCAFSLDASASSDPAHDTTSGPASLSFSWQCVAVGAGSCSGLTGSFTGPVLSVPADSLLPDTYTFIVFVTSGSGASALTSNASSQVIVSPEDTLPPIAAAAQWRSMQRISSDSGPLTATAAMGGCAAPADISWQWWLLDAEAMILLEAISEPSSGLSPASAAPAGLGLLSGGVYAFAVLGANASVLEAMQISTSLADTQALGVLTAFSAGFVADGPPVPGVVLVSPLSGEAFAHEFTVLTESWMDDGGGPFEHAFYRRSLADNSLMLNDADGSLSCKDACPSRQVDWYNRSSPHYWVRQGVVLMRPWQVLAVMTDPLPPGSFMMLARARDKAGGVGTASHIGPLVTDGRATESSAREALARVAYDPSGLMNVVSALAASNPPAAVRALAVDALQRATASSSLGADLLLQLGQTLGDVAMVLSSDVGPQASLLLSAVTAADLSARAEHTAEEAVEAVLEALRALGEAHLAGSVDATVSSALVAIAEALPGKLSVPSASLSSEVYGSSGGSEVSLGLRSQPDVAAGMSYFGGEVVLQVSTGSPPCGEVVVTQVDWRGLNVKFRLGDEWVGERGHIKYLKVSGCGAVLTLTSHVRIQFQVPPAPYLSASPVCVRYDEGDSIWSTEGVSVEGGAGGQSSVIHCLSSHTSGTFSVAYAPTTTTTATVTVPPALPPESPGAASTDFIVIAIIVSACVCCLLAFCAALLCRRLRSSRAGGGSAVPNPIRRRRFEDSADSGIGEHEHGGIGDLPRSAINISLPNQDEEDGHEDDQQNFGMESTRL